MRLIKVSFPSAKLDDVIKTIEDASPTDWINDSGSGIYEQAIEVVIAQKKCQKLIDSLQDLLAAGEDWRITVVPVEATLPRPDTKAEEEDKASKKEAAFREGLYQTVEKGSVFDVDFAVLTVLSAIVAAIGLSSDSVAIVIAAMVIAPLLGPILAFSVGAALGDAPLMIKASKTAFLGFGIGFVFAFLMTQFFPPNYESRELMDRAVVGPEMIILALASGASAALSLTTGVSSALVGVMVAVALLPPSVASAMFFGVGDTSNGFSALLLLVLNVVCTVLSAQVVFVWKGMRPRTWWEQKAAAKSVKINLSVWGIMLVGLAILVFYLS